MCRLAVISVLLAAKLEEPITPNFCKMVNMLTEVEKKNVDKQNLIELE